MIYTVMLTLIWKKLKEMIYTVRIINEVWTNSGCSSAICKLKVYLGLLHVSPVLSIYSQCNQSLKSPERECAVKYLYLYLYL
jgi:hypothetical protein